MKDDAFRFLSLMGKTPARLDADQVAWLLNCQPHDIPVLIRARLLKPLGSPPPNARKLFAADEVVELARDKAWLAKVSNAIHEGWRRKNQGRKIECNGSLEPMAESVTGSDPQFNRR